MRYPATEKLEIIRLVERSHLSVRQTLDKLGIPRPIFYRWYDRFQTHGVEGLEDRTSAPSRVWNRIPDDIRSRIIEMALDHVDLSPRELAVKFTDMESYFVSEASVYRLDAVHQHEGRRCHSHARLGAGRSGCDKVKVEHRPRLLSDNGPCYVASDLGEWPETYRINQVHGAPGHPQTQGKIERWHQTLKNRILLENYFFKEDLEAQIAAFIEHYNHRRYHESLDNLTPADVYFGRGQTILLERERIKRDTIKQRRFNHQAKAA